MQPNRRAALQWMFGLTAGTAVLPLAGCGGGSGTEDTLPEPQVLTSANGMLELELHAQYTTQTLDIASSQQAAVYPGVATRTKTELRSFNGRYAAPTLVLLQGDTLRIRLNNKLPANAPQSSLSYLNFQNSTNLHFHGLHVDPREIRPGVFGDYVVDTPDGGVMPGQSRQHELAIPSNHTTGIYWYHPHLHGSSNVQVSSGMFGAIIVRDPSERFITSPDIRERVIHVHKLNLNDGRTDSFKDSVNAPTSAFLLNGAYQPTIVMRPGEVQNWHLINTSSFYPFNPVLDEHTLWAYAKDGNVYDRRFKPINAENSGQFDDANWPGNALYPGNRHSVLVQASSTPGTYYLRSVKAPSSDGEEEIVARIVVEGEPMDTPLPSASDLPRFKDHVAITDQELADRGGKQRNLVLAVLNKDDARVMKPIPQGEDWFAPPEEGFMPNNVFAAGSVGSKLVPFQSSLTVTQTVALDAVEEWTIHSLNGYPHPFHIHVNDSYIVRINGNPVTPFWADTIPVPVNGNVTFRMRFSDFQGKFVWHCHALDHEDMGMMQLVDVVA